MIYIKTALGIEAFRSRDARLSQRSRSLLILVDGKRNEAALLSMLTSIGAGVEHLQQLQAAGFIEGREDGGVDAQSFAANASRPSVLAVAAPPSVSVADAATGLSEKERYQQAYPLAIKHTSSLGLRGFRLNLSVESAGNLADLQALAPKIREAVGPDKFAQLAKLLGV